jgi:ribosomal protein S18 acetylase RimI-like enzyme
VPENVIELRPSRSSDDREVISWFETPAELRRFAGDAVAWPLTAVQLDAWRADPELIAWSAWVSLPHEEAIVGHAQLIRRGPARGHLARVAVAPTRRGQGHGRAIVTAVLAHAASLGLDLVTLNVYRDNERGIRLYRSLGFEELDSPADQAPSLTLCLARSTSSAATSSSPGGGGAGS